MIDFDRLLVFLSVFEEDGRRSLLHSAGEFPWFTVGKEVILQRSRTGLPLFRHGAETLLGVKTA